MLSELKAEEADILPLSFPSISRSTKGVRYSIIFSINEEKAGLSPEMGIEEEKREVVGELFVVLFLLKKKRYYIAPRNGQKY